MVYSNLKSTPGLDARAAQDKNDKIGDIEIEIM